MQMFCNRAGYEPMQSTAKTIATPPMHCIRHSSHSVTRKLIYTTQCTTLYAYRLIGIVFTVAVNCCNRFNRHQPIQRPETVSLLKRV